MDKPSDNVNYSIKRKYKIDNRTWEDASFENGKGTKRWVTERKGSEGGKIKHTQKRTEYPRTLEPYQMYNSSPRRQWDKGVENISGDNGHKHYKINETQQTPNQRNSKNSKMYTYIPITYILDKFLKTKARENFQYIKKESFLKYWNKYTSQQQHYTFVRFLRITNSKGKNCMITCSCQALVSQTPRR